MPQSFRFGVELEFAVGSLYDPEARLPPENAEGKTVRFLPAHEAKSRHRLERYIWHHIKDTLNNIGLDHLAKIEGGNTEWSIGEDPSVKGPEDGGIPYVWYGVEVRSPALLFNPRSLKHIRKVCDIIYKNYVVDVNETCGLHVHVSGGLDEVIAFPTLHRLMLFLWAFEPQIDTLHPKSRQLSEYCRSMRQVSKMSQDYYQHQGIMPSTLQGLHGLRNATTSMELLGMVQPHNSRTMICNVLSMKNYLDESSRVGPFGWSPTPTIEFRQHEGTLNADRICSWVSLLMLIVEYCEKTDTFTFDQLLKNAVLEKWVKTGDVHEDAEMEALYGKVPAEEGGCFTVTDLLEEMGLDELASFYKDHVFPLVPRPTKLRAGINAWIWAYEEQKNTLPQQDYISQHASRRYWEALQQFVAACEDRPDLAIQFDPDNPIWPEHEYSRRRDLNF